MFIALEVVALTLAAVEMGLMLAHALELPGKKRLRRENYLAVQRIYYPGFSYAGLCEPLTIVAAAALLAVTPIGTPAFWLIAGALAAAGATHLMYWTLTAPINKVWLKGMALSGGAQRFFGPDSGTAVTDDWTVLRDRWERSHIYRAVTATVAFLLLAVAAGI
jgi:hypothetical protein